VTVILATLVGFLFAVSVFLLLDRSTVRMLLGLIFLSYAATLLLFVTGGVVRGKLPLVPSGAMTPPDGASDPIPQALILTAIVIGFGTLAFAAVLVTRLLSTGDDDADRLGPEADGLGGNEPS
jgi:multicomponent Na+:H+ antiporter subunit C